ncbi:carboxypeptidase-like regulatory domain-containing protein [Pedobacter panaciterrae]
MKNRISPQIAKRELKFINQTIVHEKKLLLFITVGFLLISQTFAQQKTITGKVTSTEDGLPIPGVSVKIKGTSTVVQTANNGGYSIKANENDVLVFSYVSMITQEKTVGSTTTLDVAMVPDSKALSEVVVTALGIKQQKRSLGYATQDIKAADITNTNQSNVLNALKGKASGVQITSSGGAAGSGTRVQIRGINSLNPSADNQPLFVVDGIPISNSTDLIGINSDNFQNPNRAW